MYTGRDIVTAFSPCLVIKADITIKAILFRKDNIQGNQMSQIRAIHNSFQKALKSLLEKRKYMYRKHL